MGFYLGQEMKPGGGRIKGSTFERKIADMVVRAFAQHGITRSDCYRTPSSGGHRFAKQSDPGDLVLSPALRSMFAFSVECKKYKKLDWHLLLSDSIKKGHWDSWWVQAEKASIGAKPMVVFSANRSQPFAMATIAAITAVVALKELHPYLRTVVCGKRVVVVQLASLLEAWATPRVT